MEGFFGLFTNFQNYEYIQTRLKQSEKPVSTENQSDTGEVNYTKKMRYVYKLSFDNKQKNSFKHYL